MNCLFLILAICDEHYPKTAFSFFVKSLLGQQCTVGTSLPSPARERFLPLQFL